MKIRGREVTFLGVLVISPDAVAVSCRRCKSTTPVVGEMAKALAGAVLVRTREG